MLGLQRWCRSSTSSSGVPLHLAAVPVAGSLHGERLAPVTDASTILWFSWSAYYPGTRIFSPCPA